MLARIASRALRAPLRGVAPSRFMSSSEVVSVVFVDRDGVETSIKAPVGSSLLDLALEHDLDVEGACGGECACSTCLVNLEQNIFDALPEMSEEEMDMCDLASGLTDTSRLGCQVIVQPEFEGMRVYLPEEVTNLMPE